MKTMSENDEFEITDEEFEILSKLTKETRERLEFYKKEPSSQALLSLIVIESEVMGFLKQMLALRGVRTSPYKTT